MSVEVDLTTEKGGGGKRYLSGQVVQFTYIGRDGDFYSYMAVLRPKLWHATRRTDFKIFQNQKAPDIIKSVLAKYNLSIDDKLSGSYRNWVTMVRVRRERLQLRLARDGKRGHLLLFLSQQRQPYAGAGR